MKKHGSPSKDHGHREYSIKVSMKDPKLDVFTNFGSVVASLYEDELVPAGDLLSLKKQKRLQNMKKRRL